MKPMELMQNALARLGRYFGQSERFWLNVQTECDQRNPKQLVEPIAREVHPMIGMVPA